MRPVHSNRTDVWSCRDLLNEDKDCWGRPPSSTLPQVPPSWCKPPFAPLLACRMASGRGDLLRDQMVALQLPPHLLYLVLSTLTPPISFLLFIRTGPLKLVMFALSCSCLRKSLRSASCRSRPPCPGGDEESGARGPTPPHLWLGADLDARDLS